MLDFKINMLPVKYDHSLDKAQIRVKSNASGLVSGHVQGQVNVTLVPKTKRSADGECLIFSQADVVITNTPVLRIASNYKKGSCEYNVVKTHEEKHVTVMNDFFQVLERDYKEHLQKQFLGKGSVHVSDKKIFREELLGIAQAFIRKINREQSYIHQEEVDHPDKVADERKLCSNW